MIMYSHVPSITSYPVYLGDLDKLLEPYVDGVPSEDLDHKLRLFLEAPQFLKGQPFPPE